MPTNDSLVGRTVVGIPLEAQGVGPFGGHKLEGATDLNFEQKLFKVPLAHNGKTSSTASRLMRKMYSWRGYKVAWHAKSQPNSILPVGSHGASAVATVTIGFDSQDGLKVDALYQDEVDALRARGARICEYTQLALDSVVRSRHVLASIFNIAFLYAHRMHGFTDLLIEVNPRHVRFYQQMLGFQQPGPVRISPRVNASAVLMHLPFAHSASEIDRFRHMGLAPSVVDRSTVMRFLRSKRHKS